MNNKYSTFYNTNLLCEYICISAYIRVLYQMRFKCNTKSDQIFLRGLKEKFEHIYSVDQREPVLGWLLMCTQNPSK